MNQYVIYRVKDTEIGKKLKHMPYNELGELVQEVKAENYEQIYFGLLEDNKKPYQLRKDLEKQIEPGKKLEVGDVIVTNREGLAVSHYVDTDTLLTLPGFINLTDSDAVIKVDTEDYEIEQYPGKWRSVDYLIFEGKSYFLMENQKYGKDAAALVLNQYGKVILDECKDGFDQDTIDRMKSAVQKFNEQEKQKGATKERLSVWQKYFINGEYLRSAEMAEEQNYNMIDGRINNLLPKKENPEVPKKRKSVLLRLYKHRCEVAKKQGKPMPRRYQGMEINVSFLLRLLAYVTTIPENYGIQSLIFDSVYINRVYHYLMIYNLSGFVFSDSLADLNQDNRYRDKRI